ncbi:DUF7344 domain-containing protein [Halomarina litorea]|uniref:DUF7344 domain-containing protein n=1 Tax=Halomarina litorea TaxID=2961595 RepID=UPI0020C57C7C|nr:hypothetical protein [Halomarina sp. BCD28]
MARNRTQRGHATTGTPSTRPPTIDADDVYRLLADEQRRALLAVLLERDGEMTLDDLRSRLADRVSDERNAGIRLHHVHLPKLEDAGLLTYDPETHVVTPTETADAVRSLV